MLPDRLSAIFGALADPTRRAILARLALGATTVGELSKPFRMSAPAISKHLKVLERAGLIVRSRNAQWRPCRIEALPLKDAADWLAFYQPLWEESFERLDAYLQAVKAKARKSGRTPRRKTRRSPVRQPRGLRLSG